MEISNRTFGLFCVAMVGVVVFVRAQSSKAPVVVVAAPTEVARVESKQPARKHGIPDSTVPPEMNMSIGTDDQPILVGSDANIDRPVPLPMDPSPSAPPAAPASTPQPDPNADASNLASQDDISGDVASLMDQQQQEQVSNDMQISDREVLRLMMSSMNRRQREELAALWYTMSPDDRQNLLDQVRGSQQGN